MEALTGSKEALLVGAADAAGLVGISRAHFYALHSSGRLGPMPVKLGGRTLWVREELADWCRQGCPSRERWLAMNGGTQ
jgi:predicted DNA-binding transcriptional regulator AlpA